MMAVQTTYNVLCNEFLKTAQKCINNNVLTILKNNYYHEIKSKRKLSYIKDLKTLIKILEKRDILSCDNIKPFWDISKQFIHDPILLSKLENYETWYHNNHVPIYNAYLNINNHDSVKENHLSNHKHTSDIAQHNMHAQTSCSMNIMKNNKEQEDLRLTVLLHVSERLGNSWRDVTRYLGIRECEINTIQNEFPCDLERQSYEALKICIYQYNINSWKIHLIKALEKGRRRDLKEAVEKLIM